MDNLIRIEQTEIFPTTMMNPSCALIAVQYVDCLNWIQLTARAHLLGNLTTEREFRGDWTLPYVRRTTMPVKHYLIHGSNRPLYEAPEGV